MIRKFNQIFFNLIFLKMKTKINLFQFLVKDIIKKIFFKKIKLYKKNSF